MNDQRNAIFFFFFEKNDALVTYLFAPPSLDNKIITRNSDKFFKISWFVYFREMQLMNSVPITRDVHVQGWGLKQSLINLQNS